MEDIARGLGCVLLIAFFCWMVGMFLAMLCGENGSNCAFILAPVMALKQTDIFLKR